MSTATNRRKNTRFRTDVMIWLQGEWEPEPITLLELSAGGMLCRFPVAVEAEDRVRLHLEFPGHERRIQCYCRVVHCREQEEAFFHVGLALESLEGMSRQNFIDRLKNGLPASTSEEK